MKWATATQLKADCHKSKEKKKHKKTHKKHSPFDGTHAPMGSKDVYGRE